MFLTCSYLFPGTLAPSEKRKERGDYQDGDPSQVILLADRVKGLINLSPPLHAYMASGPTMPHNPQPVPR